MTLPFGIDAPLGMIEPLLIVTITGILLLLIDLVLPQGLIGIAIDLPR